MSLHSRTNCLLCGKKSEGLPHFRFPFNVVLRSAWANACGVDPASIAKTQRLCCKHFSPDDYSDYFIQNVETSRTRLKFGSIPTLELPRFVDEDNDYVVSMDEKDINDVLIKRNKLAENIVDSVSENSAESDLVVNENDSTQFSDLAADSNVDNGLEDNDDDNDILINYDEYGDEIPSELNNLTDLSRFIKKKTRLYRTLQLSNSRLKKRFANVVKEYFEYGDDQGIQLPALDDLDLDL